MKKQLTLTMNPKYHYAYILGNISVPTKKEQFKVIEGANCEIKTMDDNGVVIKSQIKSLYYTDSEAKNVEFEKYIKESIKFDDKPLKGMIELVICVTDKESRIKIIDTDNLAKSVMDALKGIVYENDSQVYSLTVLKDSMQTKIFQSLMIAIRKIENIRDTAYPITLFTRKEESVVEEAV